MEQVGADDLFVFAGAGLSLPPPSGLPVFWQIRDSVLRQLGMDEFVPPSETPPFRSNRSSSPRERLAEGLLPEPFLQLLEDSGVPVNPWLDELLEVKTPNAGHRCVAELIAQGATAWTVNFDTGIEQAAGGRLVVHDLDHHPLADADLRKPHGTWHGKKLFQGRDVMAGLPRDWESLLRAEVADRIVVLVGYSGNDLDFRPIWDNVLQSSRHVIWFCMNDAEEAAKRRLLPRTANRGLLSTPLPQPHPVFANPTLEFARWCRDNRLVSLDSAEVEHLGDKPKHRSFPVLEGNLAEAEAEARATLGDYQGAKHSYLHQLRRDPTQLHTMRRLLNLAINHGGRPTAAALAMGATLMSPIPGLSSPYQRVLQKRSSTLLNIGRPDKALQVLHQSNGDESLAAKATRSGALKYGGSLRDAARLARQVIDEALTSEKPNAVVVSNAALQLVLALLWGGHVKEARDAYAREFCEYAPISASRWVAWSRFLDASIVIHAGEEARGTEVIDELDEAIAMFEASRLVDGMISSLLVKLAAHRWSKDTAWWNHDRRRLQLLLDHPPADSLSYIHHSANLASSVYLEDAQWAHFHRNCPSDAGRLYRAAAKNSRHTPLLAAQANLGLHATLSNPSAQRTALRKARQLCVTAAADGLIVEVIRRENSQPANELLIP